MAMAHKKNLLLMDNDSFLCITVPSCSVFTNRRPALLRSYDFHFSNQAGVCFISVLENS